MHNLSLAASVMAMDHSVLGDEIRAYDAAGVDIFHWDIMDGHFVPNITVGPGVLHDLRTATTKEFDTHLMMTEPTHWIDDFAKAGSDAITFHAEIRLDHIAVAESIRAHGIKAGLAFNPDTALHHVPDEVFAHLDRILIMTVFPGFGGQKFIDQSTKIQQAAALKSRFPQLQISVDGGINLNTAPIAIQAGTDILVSGSALNQAASQKDFITAIKSSARKSGSAENQA